MSYFVENKGVGSLYAYLHKIGLITDIWVSTKIYDRGAAVLEVRFDLTKFGLEQADTVIQHFFEVKQKIFPFLFTPIACFINY